MIKQKLSAAATSGGAMTPLKQRTPGCTPGNGKKIHAIISRQDNSHIARMAQPFTCRQCAFHELVTRKRGYVVGLCHFTGLPDPQPGQDGCYYLPGRWDEIDDILGLTRECSRHSLELPNTDRLSDGLYHPQNDKNSGFFDLISNFTCPNRHGYKLRHNVQEPARAGGLSVAGERYAVFRFKTQNTEVNHA